MTWIKGMGGQGGTIRQAITYAVSGILLTVFRYFAKLLAQQVVVASCLFRGKKRHEKICQKRCPGCLARGCGWH